MSDDEMPAETAFDGPGPPTVGEHHGRAAAGAAVVRPAPDVAIALGHRGTRRAAR